MKEFLGNGRFWMIWWIIWTTVVVVWGILSMVFWQDSILNLTMLSIFALVLACGAGFQSSLAMREADPEDDI